MSAARRLEAARVYIAHAETLDLEDLARELVRRFALPRSTSVGVLLEELNPRVSPAYSQAELEAAVREAEGVDR